MKNLVANARDWRLWLRGLIGAAIGGAANGITVMIVEPQSFNFDAGLADLGKVVLISAIFGAGLYLKQKPIAEPSES